MVSGTEAPTGRFLLAIGLTPLTHLSPLGCVLNHHCAKGICVHQTLINLVFDCMAGRDSDS